MPWLHGRSCLEFRSGRGWNIIRYNRHLFSFTCNSSSWCAQYCDSSQCQGLGTTTALALMAANVATASGSLSSSTNLMVSTWIFVVNRCTALCEMCKIKDTITKTLILVTHLNNNLYVCCFLQVASSFFMMIGFVCGLLEAREYLMRM